MSDEFDDLDATEKAGFEAARDRCRRLAAEIASELRNKRPEHSLTSWRWRTFARSLSTLTMFSDRKWLVAKHLLPWLRIWRCRTVSELGRFVSPRSRGHGADFCWSST